jgi:hypothetical protein
VGGGSLSEKSRLPNDRPSGENCRGSARMSRFPAEQAASRAILYKEEEAVLERRVIEGGHAFSCGQSKEVGGGGITDCRRKQIEQIEQISEHWIAFHSHSSFDARIWIVIHLDRSHSIPRGRSAGGCLISKRESLLAVAQTRDIHGEVRIGCRSLS